MAYDDEKTYDSELKRTIGLYEDMLRHDKKVYFDEDDLLDIAEYYYYDMSKDAEALRCLDYALKLHPESQLIKLHIAEIYYFMGKTAEAWKLLKSLPEQEDPDVQYYYGLFYLKEKNYEQADLHYREAYSLEQGTGVELFCSIINDYLEHEITKGLDIWFNILPEAYADDTQVRNVKVAYLQMSGQLQEAVKLVEKQIDEEPYNASHWINLTKLHIQMGEYGKARESNTYVLDIEADNTEAKYLSAVIEFESDNYEKAHELYDKYIAIEDKDPYVYYNNAFCLYYMQDLDAALQQLYYARKFANKNDIKFVQKTHLLISTILAYKKRFNEAKDSLDKAYKLGMSDEEYMTYHAMLMYNKGDITQAIQLLDKSLSLYLKKDAFPEHVLNIHIALGTFNDMITALDKITSHEPTNANVRKAMLTQSLPYYAFAYYGINDEDKFLQYLKQAIEVSPTTVLHLFSKIFPANLDVKDYYEYAAQGGLDINKTI